MAQRGKDEVFTIIVTHEEDGPTFEELMNSLHDWFYGLLVTGELKRFRNDEDEIRARSDDK